MRSTRGVSIPATTCALVTTRPGPATQPEPSMPSPQAVPTTRTTLRAASLTPAESSTAGVGRVHACRGPRERGERVDLRERVDQAVRRHLLVELREDRRVLGVVAQVGLLREIEEHGADGPAEREARDGAEDAAADVVEQAQAGRGRGAPGGGGGRRSSRSSGRSRHRPSRHRGRRAGATAPGRRR